MIFNIVDGPIASELFYLSDMTSGMLLKFIAVVFITPVFLGPGVTVAVLGGICGQIYIKAQLSIKREMSNAKAPVLGQYAMFNLANILSLISCVASVHLLLV